jgi:3-oxoacyl-[acyl-carrier protein] reductase
MDLKLGKKVALITGASKGLGYAIANILAQEGATVVINSRNKERIQNAAQHLTQNTGNKVVGFEGDVTSHEFAETIIHQVAEQLGGVDILITNAGGPPSGKFESFNDDEWQEAIELSFLSHMRLIRAALPVLRKSNSPVVLTITSYSVKQPIQNLVLSNSIRAATIGLTKTLALELGHEGIRFNSILPAWTETDRIIELLEQRAKINNTSLEEELKKQTKNSPLGRMATPDEFAYAAAFLVSPLASYITGVMLPVDGGMYKGLM